MNFKQLILAGTVIASTTLTPLTNVQAENTIGFKDVPEHHWSYKAIMDLQEKNIVSGYGNGIFGFGDSITRGQVARMLYAYLKPADEPNLPNPYTDVKNHMFEKEILTLSKAGIISGFGDGKFGPDRILTREQLAAVLTNAFHLKATSTTTFKDVNKNYWATNAISALEENKIAAGTGDNMFEPYTIVTREQYAQFLYNAIIKSEKPEKEPESKPTVIPQELADELIYYYEGWMDSSSVLKKSISKEAQNLITGINAKHNAELKYIAIGGPRSEVVLFSPVLEGIPEFNGNFTVEGDNESNFTVNFVIDRGQGKKALIELGKKWITMINPNLDLSTEIDNIVASNTRTGTFDINKNNLKIEISIEKQNSSSDLMSVKIQK
ncbi:S-layer homology domain-containing protein [Bacillus wiedmannii]|uniref:S-layer homology domain-containing protein n=1 Tax=Bacillus wiedmannii TaxID=1890302 RepID=UPI00065B9FD2|nr:S-layer homology domain-containing protein [Bacillus wiedmannii]KMP75284.1 S-layer protein [Bacillus cereus]MCQ6545963.1 S-layer homology domain-containing protein [Bacillus wiedmannii]MCQ6572855.1 S-layer homology domain-containing protein [Bacillus wiedmannii]MCU5578359.1 S-layer homology domain-containing protein [Bacillus wiedmannii]WMS83077.1 S-layer homology domain-containing protein [Bacillus wiedmannii]